MPAQKLSNHGTAYALQESRSRLVIVAHGDSTSRGINGSLALTSRKLAEFVSRLLDGDGPVDRVTLHMCYGGGNVGAGVGFEGSIAWDFARHAGDIAREVTARTDEVGGSYNPDTLRGFERTVGGRAGAAQERQGRVHGRCLSSRRQGCLRR